MPESVWSQTIKLAHEEHQGMVRTKARLKEKVWWLQMDKQVETTIRSCHPCHVGPRGKPGPIRSTILSEGPWTDLAVDLVEIPGGTLARGGTAKENRCMARTKQHESHV